MHTHSNTTSKKPSRIFRKLLLSAFVVFSFVAYAIHKPLADPGNRLSQITSGPGGQVTLTLPSSSLSTQPSSTNVPSQTGTTSQGDPGTTTATPQLAIVPSTTPQASPTSASGRYKNGTYTGNPADAFYGTVQVQVVIQNGWITSVQFLNYPHDRQTSARINSFAMPYLQQEAIQVQNANVDLISGATLTSQAFVMSLRSALSQAGG